MKRILSAFILLASLGFAPSSAHAASNGLQLEKMGITPGVMLRESAMVSSKVIYLGDVFANTGDKGNIALAYAPGAGKRAVFDARWLYRVAKAYKLDWRPLTNRDQIVVQRVSSVITQDEIAEQLREHLADKGADPDMEIHFSNRLLQMHVVGEGIYDIGFEDVSFDPRSKRFSAIAHAPAGDPAAPRTRITGQLFDMTEVPVTARRILKGEVINKSDLQWVRVRTNRLQNDAVASMEELVGKTPKRGLREGVPIRSSAIQDPILVEKGSLVTIILRADKMLLTAQGKAMQPGSDGDIIRITNTQSNKSIEAEVIGSGRVAVRQSTLVALN